MFNSLLHFFNIRNVFLQNYLRKSGDFLENREVGRYLKKKANIGKYPDKLGDIESPGCLVEGNTKDYKKEN